MKTEIQTCPDRNAMPGPWKIGNGLDKWRTDRWSRNILVIRFWHWVDHIFDLLKNGKQTHFIGKHNNEWLWKWGPPRTCSFCGGIHPEDAIRLIQDGWEIEATGKTYKRYLEPPGYHQHMADLRQTIATSDKVPEFWSPVPPVKLYVSHFNDDQVSRFNQALHSDK
jgi:hypothetical protein